MNVEPIAGDLGEVPRDQLRSIYDALKEIARRELSRDRNPGGLEATDLVHECYLKLAKLDAFRTTDRTVFLAAAASLIRQVLVDQARERLAGKRGGGWHRVTLSEGAALTGSDGIDLLELDVALQKLSELDPRQSKIVELRFFGGLSADEVGRLLNLSRRTITKEWGMARAWLRNEIGQGPTPA